MILNREDADSLIAFLKAECPVDTGNLMNLGIQGVQDAPEIKGYIIQIGFPASIEGAKPTEEYAWYTEFTNKSSIGWIQRAIVKWWNSIQPSIEVRMEENLDVEL